MNSVAIIAGLFFGFVWTSYTFDESQEVTKRPQLPSDDRVACPSFSGSEIHFGWTFHLISAVAYLLINGSCRVVGCRRLRRGPPFPQRFGGASSVVEQRTRLVAEAEAVKVEGPL